MLVAAFTWGDLGRLALAVFVGLSFAYLLVRLAGTVAKLSALIRGAGDSVLPVIGKVGGSVDRVNGQLDKVDRITDSAVDGYGAADFKVGRERRHAVQGKDAAARRESDLAEGLWETRT